MIKPREDVCFTFQSIYYKKSPLLYIAANEFPKTCGVFPCFQAGSYSFAYGMKIILQRQLIHHREHHTLSAFIFKHAALLLRGKVCRAAVSQEVACWLF